MKTYKHQRAIFLLFNLFSITTISHGHGNSFATKLELIHRHDLLKNHRSNPITRLDRLKHSINSDTTRIRTMSQNINLNRAIKRRKIQENDPPCKDYNVSGELAIHSGADYGTGQYFVHLKVGSPAQEVMVVADTGSDLTWMKCRYRCNNIGGKCGRNVKNRHVFRADVSSSFRSVPCSSSMCKVELANLFSLARCDSPMDGCAYDYRYSDGSSSLGIFANETVTFSLTNGRKTRLRNVLIGCGESVTGQSFQAADGVIGLGYSNYSFALKAANTFGGKFSYCLVDHLSPQNISSYLIFGSHQEISSKLDKMQYTELVLGAIPPFYAVNLKGISINGIILGIPFEVWNVNGVGGVIIDSGTSLTVLTQPAYGPVMDAMKLALLGFRELDLGIGPLEYCFNSTGFDEDLAPRLAFHFGDGARFEPPVKSYVIDAADEVKCLGFVAAAWPGVSVIGNIMQQNYLWEYDIANGRLGFASSSCT